MVTSYSTEILIYNGSISHSLALVHGFQILSGIYSIFSGRKVDLKPPFGHSFVSVYCNETKNVTVWRRDEENFEKWTWEIADTISNLSFVSSK